MFPVSTVVWIFLYPFCLAKTVSLLIICCAIFFSLKSFAAPICRRKKISRYSLENEAPYKTGQPVSFLDDKKKEFPK